MNTNKKLHNIVVAGLLCAIGIMVPSFMPRIVLGPMSFTLASHVAIFIAMFISPVVAVAVSIGTTIGFFMTAPPIIALRAASHLIFAIVGAMIIKKKPSIMKHIFSSIVFGLAIGILHAVSEIVVVTPVFLNGSLFSAEQLQNGYVMSVLVLVGLGTLIHSMIDYVISLVIWKPLEMTVYKNKAVSENV
ncbi:MAG: hypothetical protein RR048_05795 [Oscillospiraceae bacterium]